MAGRGSRFLAQSETRPEYAVPKPIIQVKSKPMVQWSIESLPFVSLPGRDTSTEFVVFPHDLVFIILKEHEREFNVSSILTKSFGSKISIVEIPTVTRGAVETVLAAEKYINPGEDLLITDSDHYYDGTAQYKAILDKTEGVSGIIPVFTPPDLEPKWSYSLLASDSSILEVAEKDPKLAQMGAHANIGSYYFTRAEIFLQEAHQMIADLEMYGPKDKQEFYIAPLYQKLIDKNHRISAAIIDKLWGLGTPSDLEIFLKEYKR